MMTVGPDARAPIPKSFVHSRYIILWACNTISTNTHHWPFIAEAQKRGAKIVVVDPVRTRTARQADWHIPIKPGTDGALAMAMMNVIISEGLVDQDYVASYTVGYEELAERAKRVSAGEGGVDHRHRGRTTSASSRASTRPRALR